MAIKIANTTVIDDNRNLVNVGGLKTINGNSILGAGDIVSGDVTTTGTQTLTNKTLTSPVIDTQLTLGSGGRIIRNFTSDLSPAFVTSTTDAETIVSISPNGAGIASALELRSGSSSPYAYGMIASTPYGFTIKSSAPGISPVPSITLQVDNATFQFNPAGSLGIGGSAGTAGQVLTSNGISSAVSWTSPQVTLSNTATLTNKTLSGVVLSDGYTEGVFSVFGTTPALSPTNGSIQTWTLSANSTPTAGAWAAGQSITLMIDDGSAATVTWTSLAVTWKTDGGLAPTLNTTGYTAIALWKVGSVIYGARVGDA